jgi:hypothetical protein
MRIVSGITQRLSHPVHRGANAMVEVNLGVVRPEFPANLFPRHYVAGALKQHCKDSKRLFGKTDGVTTVPAKLTGTKIKFEIFEPNHTTIASYVLHATSPRARILALVYARCGHGGLTS